jgi:hypothetical protein
MPTAIEIQVTRMPNRSKTMLVTGPMRASASCGSSDIATLLPRTAKRIASTTKMARATSQNLARLARP